MIISSPSGSKTQMQCRSLMVCGTTSNVVKMTLVIVLCPILSAAASGSAAHGAQFGDGRRPRHSNGRPGLDRVFATYRLGRFDFPDASAALLAWAGMTESEQVGQNLYPVRSTRKASPSSLAADFQLQAFSFSGKPAATSVT